MPIYQYVAKQVLFSQQIRNVFYYEAPTTLDATQQQGFADAWRTALVGVRPASSWIDDWQLYGMYVRRVDVAGYLGVDLTFTNGVLTGTATSQPEPTQICLLVSGKATTTPPNHVRTYWGALAEDNLDTTGLWTSSTLTSFLNMTVALDTLTFSAVDIVRQCVQWSVVTPQYVADWNPINAYTPSAVPATQRRRRIGVGG